MSSSRIKGECRVSVVVQGEYVSPAVVQGKCGGVVVMEGLILPVPDDARWRIARHLHTHSHTATACHTNRASSWLAYDTRSSCSVTLRVSNLLMAR